MNKPVIAIVGRPNVGKSTLFNVLTRSRDALVADIPGVTRDRQYGHGEFAGQEFIVIDTGGMADREGVLDDLTEEQAKLATSEADFVVMVVDATAGVTAADRDIVDQLRQLNKPIFVAANKSESLNSHDACADFHSFGFQNVAAISAAHNQGINPLFEQILSNVESVAPTAEEEKLKGIRIAVIGQPNVGKSTLINRMLGEQRMIVYDEAGTTRDSIFVSLQRQGKSYVLIDTAGIRRRARVKEKVEKFSIIKALQAIEVADVVIYLVDAKNGVAQQDMHLLEYVLNAGRALVLAINKWDGLEADVRNHMKQEMDRRLGFVDFAPQHFISALHGTGVGDLFNSVEQCYESAMRTIPANQLTQLLQQAVTRQSPPLVKGRRVRLKYAHIGGHNPPRIVIHGNQTRAVPETYKRYLVNYFRKKLRLVGTPIKIEFKSNANPYV